MPSLPCGKHRLFKNAFVKQCFTKAYQSGSLEIWKFLRCRIDKNAFLRGHKIIAVTKEFVATGENSFYSIIAEYIDTSFAPAADKGKASVDYKEVLKPEVFELFSYLRDERKKLAEQAGIPVYAVVTNAQLAQIAEKKPQTISALAQIEGVGQGKCEKFGESFLKAIQDYEKKRQTVPANHWVGQSAHCLL